MSVLPGNPSVVASGAQTLQSRAGRIADAIELLRSIALDGKSEALDKIRSKTLSTSNTIQRAENRYSATGIALSDYATKLRNAHKKADAAEERRRQAQMEQEAWQEQRSRSVQQLRNIENSEVPQHVVDRVQAEYRHADRRADAAGSAVSSAQADIEAARQEMNAAAEHAIGLIEAAIDGTNDTFRDKISNFFAPLVEGFANFINWVGDHLVKLLNGLWEVAKLVFKWIKRILRVVIIIVVGLAMVFALLTLLVTLFPVLLPAAVVVAKITLVVAGIALIVWAVEEFKDFFKPVKSKPYSPGSMFKDKAYQAERERVASSRARVGDFVNGKRVDKDESYQKVSDFMHTMGAVDSMGGPVLDDDEAVVDIKKLDGNPPRWVVTIPSTQDSNNSAPNDWTHNYLLKMRAANDPTAYEQQILEAMRRAGIQPTDEVMVQGFSQGGIMAARLAANEDSGFNVVNVLTVGSPIDDVNIPHKSNGGQDVHVLSVAHQSDPVPMLDAVSFNADHPSFTSVTLPNPVIHGVEKKYHEAHNSDYYRSSTEQYLAAHPEVEANFSRFTAPSSNEHNGATVSEHYLISITEE